MVSPCGPQVERSPLIAFSHTLLLFLLLPTSACASPSSSSSLVVLPLPPFATRLLFSHLSPTPFPSPLSRRHPCLPLARFLPRPSRETSACTRMSRDFSQTLPFAPSSSCALALLFSLSRSRARLLPGRITYNYLKTRLHGAWERLSTLVMPSQSRVHIGPLETSSKTRRRGEMLMRPGWRGRREGRQASLPYRFLLRWNRCSASRLPGRLLDPRCSRRLHIFGMFTTDRSDRSIDGRTLDKDSFSRM